MKIELGGLAFITTAVFLTLKLTGVIDWSYWWVFSPLIAVAAFAIIVMAFVGICLALAVKYGDK
jgi:hypothetical protein